VLSDRSKCDLVSHPWHQGQSKLGTSNYTRKSLDGSVSSGRGRLAPGRSALPSHPRAQRAAEPSFVSFLPSIPQPSL
jgi:hypothetical protein